MLNFYFGFEDIVITAVSFESLLSKIEHASYNHAQIEQRSKKLLALVARQVVKDLGAPDGAVSIRKFCAEDFVGAEDEIPEGATEYTVGLTVIHAKLCVNIKAKREAEIIQFEDIASSRREINLYELDMIDGTRVANAIKDLSEQIIMMFDKQAEKFRP
jgi:hypothetical protein